MLTQISLKILGLRNPLCRLLLRERRRSKWTYYDRLKRLLLGSSSYMNRTF